MANFIVEIYDENRNNPLCSKIIKIISVFYIVMVAVVVAYIGISTALSGKMVLILPILYPGIDIDENNGFILNTILHILLALMAGASSLAFDGLVTMVFINMSMVSQFLTEKIDSLQELLRKRELVVPTSRQRMLANILSHIKYNR